MAQHSHEPPTLKMMLIQNELNRFELRFHAIWFSGCLCVFLFFFYYYFLCFVYLRELNWYLIIPPMHRKTGVECLPMMMPVSLYGCLFVHSFYSQLIRLCVWITWLHMCNCRKHFMEALGFRLYHGLLIFRLLHWVCSYCGVFYILHLALRSDINIIWRH